MLLRGTRHSSCIRPRMEIGGAPVHGRARAFPKKERESRIYIYAYHEENMPRNAPRALKRGWPDRGEPTRGKEEAEADARVQKKKQLHPVHPTILSLSLFLSLFPTALLTLAFWFYAFISLSRLPIFCRPFSPKGNDTRCEISRSVYTGEDFLIATFSPCDCVKSWILNACVMR